MPLAWRGRSPPRRQSARRDGAAMLRALSQSVATGVESPDHNVSETLVECVRGVGECAERRKFGQALHESFRLANQLSGFNGTSANADRVIEGHDQPGRAASQCGKELGPVTTRKVVLFSQQCRGITEPRDGPPVREVVDARRIAPHQDRVVVARALTDVTGDLTE